jgi:hypothetical protein
VADKDNQQEREPRDTVAGGVAENEAGEEFDVVETDEQGKPIAQVNGAEVAGGRQGDERAEEDDDDDDERTALGDDASERREQRRLRKERRRIAMERDRQTIRLQSQQLDEMQRRIDELQRRQGMSEAGQLQQRMQGARDLVARANATLQDALSKNQSDRAVRAMQVRDEANDELRRLEDANEYLRRQVREPPATRRVERDVQPVPADVMEQVNKFKRKYPWYDDAGGNTDSQVVLALDAGVAEDGFDMSTPEYWRELDKRVSRALPHRASPRREGSANGDGENGTGNGRSPAGRRGPPVGGSGSQELASRGGKRAVYITPERKQAMIDAGKWDDPKERQRMLKYYADHDAKSAADRRGAR